MGYVRIICCTYARTVTRNRSFNTATQQQVCSKCTLVKILGDFSSQGKEPVQGVRQQDGPPAASPHRIFGAPTTTGTGMWHALHYMHITAQHITPLQRPVNALSLPSKT